MRRQPDSTEKHHTAEAEFQRVYPEPQAATCTYNALGQRVAKTVNGITTFFNIGPGATAAFYSALLFFFMCSQ